MPRQTISLTDPNHAWLQARVDSGEFKTHTEAVNDALRRAREKERELAFLQDKLARSAESGVSDQTPDQILAEAKARVRAKNDI